MRNIVWKYHPETIDQREHFKFTASLAVANELEVQLANLKCITYHRYNDEEIDAHFDVYFSPRAEKAEYKQVLALGEKELVYLTSTN